MSGESKDGIEMRELINKCEFVKVKHMKDTSKYKPKDGGTWKEYWEKKMSPKTFPKQAEKCACCKDTVEAEDFVGAHIQEVNYPYSKYIYPLCKNCNDRYGSNKEESPEFFVLKEYCVDFVKEEATVEDVG